MSTPQDAPAGKHHAPQEVPQAGNGRSGVPLVRLVNAGKRYGAVIALHDINMEVGAGEVTCVLGDNGAGKSTLIKIIAGLHAAVHGHLRGGGHAGPLLLAPRGARARHRHRLPGPGRGGADAGLAELLPRQRGPQGPPDGRSGP